MRKRLQLALMASPVIATFLFLTTPHVQAQSSPGGGSIVATTDRSGHTIYVNDAVPAPTKTRRASASRRSRLVYWSATKHRWKPVPTANIRAARSAAAEVGRYVGENSDGVSQTPTSRYVRRRKLTPAEIDAAIEQAAARHNVDPNLVRAVIKVESNFNPNAVSRKGAMGLMQLMPQTARELHLTNPFDPEQNVDAGVRHLKTLMENFGGDVRLSLAAYNAGAGAVQRSGGIPHIAETRNYVRRITELYNSGASAEFLASPARAPIRVGRDAQGALYFSNTE
jgi:soluble lytic murein transglycosylase-like protein